jgi:mycofactocin precursor
MTAVATESVTAAAPVPVEAGVEVVLADLVLADMLVEEISIDGMCGVY